MAEPEALLRLQDIDIKLMRIHAQLDAMPQQQKLATIARAQRQLARQTTIIVGQLKDAQMELEDNESQHALVLEKIAKVKLEAHAREAGFRQTRDLEAHLSALAKQQEKIEHAYMEKAAALEHLQKAESNARAMAERLVAEKTAQKDLFEKDSADLRAEERLLKSERAQVITEISAEVIKRYEQACKRFGGLAVEALRGNVPSVCRVKLQPADFGDLRRGPEISTCPYCHRILITKGALA